MRIKEALNMTDNSLPQDDEPTLAISRIIRFWELGRFITSLAAAGLGIYVGMVGEHGSVEAKRWSMLLGALWCLLVWNALYSFGPVIHLHTASRRRAVSPWALLWAIVLLQIILVYSGLWMRLTNLFFLGSLRHN
jgi:hypothetical protein